MSPDVRVLKGIFFSQLILNGGISYFASHAVIEDAMQTAGQAQMVDPFTVKISLIIGIATWLLFMFLLTFYIGRAIFKKVNRETSSANVIYTKVYCILMSVALLFKSVFTAINFTWPFVSSIISAFAVAGGFLLLVKNEDFAGRYARNSVLFAALTFLI